MQYYPIMIRQRGFTLIELIVILVIAGVLAVFALGRFTGSDSFDARGYYDELVAATRYAQRYAVASGCDVQIDIQAGSFSVTMENAPCPSGVGAFGTNVQRPDGGNFAGAAPSGVSVTSTGTFRFDPFGDETTGGGTITVSGGGTTLSFTVTPGSGFVDLP